MKNARDILIIARHEMSDAVRSRRAVIILLLYVAVILLSCNGIVSSLRRAEAQISKTLGLPPSAEAGTVIDNLWKSNSFRSTVRELIGDKELAEQLISVHPMAIVFGLLAFTLTPVFSVLIASPRIAEERASGSIRLALMRTSRGAWCLGKYIGQALMTLAALTLSAMCAWILLRLRVAGMNDLAVARGMIIFAWKAWVYALAFLGLALGISQVTSSPNKAMALGFAGWIALAVLAVMGDAWAGEGWAQGWHGVWMLVPGGHRLDLWRRDAAHNVPAVVFLVSLGLAYLSIGHAGLSRKDL